MKLCIFSDIHGNGPVFEEALPKILAEKADQYIFLGDLCGYYYDQMAIFSKLNGIPNLISLKGNHDVMFLQIVNGDDKLRTEYLDRFGPSMECLLSQENEELIHWLTSLPVVYYDSDNSFSCYHASPRNPTEEYIYPDSNISFFRDLRPSMFFLGHTHHRMIRTFDHRSIINPGSLGQPRDGGLPSYATVNLSGGRIEFKEIDCDGWKRSGPE